MTPAEKVRVKIERFLAERQRVCTTVAGEGVPDDLAKVDIASQLLVGQPAHRAAYLALKAATAARLGIGRCGPRYLTAPWLRFRADHAQAQDTVFREVAPNYFGELTEIEVRSRCRDKEEFLTRPDLGRQLDAENLTLLRKSCQPDPPVQLYIADGLSSAAVEANGIDCYLAIEQGLKGQGIALGTPFFLRYGRVRSMEPIAQVLQPEVIAVLIGERPGLVSAESMSCYLAYRPTPGMPESRRTVISNIHRQGTPAVEAGAYIAEVILQALAQQASGLALKL